HHVPGRSAPLYLDNKRATAAVYSQHIGKVLERLLLGEDENLVRVRQHSVGVLHEPPLHVFFATSLIRKRRWRQFHEGGSRLVISQLVEHTSPQWREHTKQARPFVKRLMWIQTAQRRRTPYPRRALTPRTTGTGTGLRPVPRWRVRRHVRSAVGGCRAAPRSSTRSLPRNTANGWVAVNRRGGV